MLKKTKILDYRDVFKETYNGFVEDKGLKLSASLAYYTIFSLAPMIIVLLSIGGIFYGKEALQGKIFSKIKDFIGAEFTWAYAKVRGEEIRPSKYAVSVKKMEIEQGKQPVDQEKIFK